MKKIFKSSLLSLSTLFIAVSNAHATSYQIFSGINYSNPAALNSVKNDELILGSAALNARFQFSGTAAGVTGKTGSNTIDHLPYGRFAKRLSPKIVVGLDVTEPYFTNIRYPLNSFINQFATTTILRDVNYSPKISYQVNERLALGLGFDANSMDDAQLNFAILPTGNMINEARSWAYGWDAGLFYAITPTTLFNFSYYSKIIQHLKGTSTWGSSQSSLLSANSVLPATFVGNIVQFMSKQWLLSATVRYTQWSSLRYIILHSTAAGDITIPYFFYNNISTELATRYQINDKWAGIGAIDVEPNVQPTAYRNPGLPTYARYYPTVGAEYEFAKGLKGKLLYSYVFSRPPIDMSIGSGQHISGHERINANAVDLSFTYDV